MASLVGLVARRLPRPLGNEFAFALLRSPKRRGRVDPTATAVTGILDRLSRDGVPVRELGISVPEYCDYVEQAGYRTQYPMYYAANRVEKSLEHFIAQKLLALTPADVYLDIASEQSPVPEIYQRLFGCRTYAQDLAYPAGIHGCRIGGDAAGLPVPDGFASAMGLHCSFEHFEGDADRGFVLECARVLRPGGAAVVVPLYLNDVYAIQTDPVTAIVDQVRFEADAVLFAVPRWGNRHGRFYDREHLRRRLMTELPACLQFEIVSVPNVAEVDRSCYAKVALLIRRGR